MKEPLIHYCAQAIRRWNSPQNAHLPLSKLRFFVEIRLVLLVLVT